MGKEQMNDKVDLDDASALAALQWHLDVGADHLMADQPVELRDPAAQMTMTPAPTAPAQTQDAAPVPGLMSQKQSEWVAQAVAMAAQADSLDALRQAIHDFDGLTFKKSAKNNVFAEGNAGSNIMVIGDAPGTEEDRQGQPFQGPEGVLLTRMFEAIGLQRGQDYYLTQMVNWRPPGNRSPSDAELQMALPFIERHIALVKPKILVLIGNITAKTMLNTGTGLTRLRGKWHDYRFNHPQLCMDALMQEAGIATAPLYHPAFLIRAPLQKAKAWSDLLMIKDKMSQICDD